MTYRDFLSKFIRVKDPVTNAIGPMRLHPEQDRLVSALDARDESGGRLIREAVLSWPRKGGKSATDGSIGLYMLVADPFETDREVAILTSDLQQSKDSVYAAVRQMRARNPWLREHIRILRTEAIYTDEAGMEHVLRVLPRDPRGIHGLNLSCLISDETWVHDSWDLLEGVSPSPARRNPLVIWSSYAGLRHQRQPGTPWFDILTRAQAGDDPRLFYSHITGRDGALSIPWISEDWLDRMARQFAHVPSKFQRLALNLWASGDAGSFLTNAEVHDAIDRSRAGTLSGPMPGCTIGVDLGLSHDTTALVGSRMDDQARLIVEAVEIYRGTPTKPVSLTMIEDRIIAMAAILGTRKVVADRWQFALLAERLSARGLWVTQKTSDATSLDRWATDLKRWFATRSIRIPNHAGLIEQLEGLEAEELRRRDRVRFTATGHHRDDAAIALVLSAEPCASRVGQLRMADMLWCALEKNGRGLVSACYLTGIGTYIPMGDPSCRECAGHISTVAAHRDYVTRTGEVGVGLREFVRAGLIAPNSVITSAKLHERMQYW